MVKEIAIVLTACGIETYYRLPLNDRLEIAIVLTACGIETLRIAIPLPYLDA